MIYLGQLTAEYHGTLILCRAKSESGLFSSASGPFESKPFFFLMQELAISIQAKEAGKSNQAKI